MLVSGYILNTEFEQLCELTASAKNSTSDDIYFSWPAWPSSTHTSWHELMEHLFFCFLGLHLRHMEAPKLGVESELQLPAYTRVTATPDPNHVCDLHHSSRNARSLTHWAKPGIKPETSWFIVVICFYCTTMGTAFFLIYFLLGYSWFTVLCQLWLYSIVTQSYIYVHSFSHIT